MNHIWWERVPNALSFISDVTNSLIEEKSVILQYTDALPWRDTFVASVQNSVQQSNSSKRFDNIRGVEDPGIFLLDTNCKREKRTQYRPTKSYACFFAESDDIVLHERYFWVIIETKKQLEVWSTFVSDYVKARDRNKEKAVFILEWHGENQVSRRKGILFYSYDNYIGSYDSIVFSTLASSSIKQALFINQYLAALSAAVTGRDIELCAACLAKYEDFLHCPYDVVSNLVSSSRRSDESSYAFSKTRDEVKHCIWLAQIKTVYPVIEEFRKAFVSRYQNSIQSKLPISTLYGEQYTEPSDVELGTLVYMTNTADLQIPPEDYDKLIAFRDARNRLSHLDTLDFDQLQKLYLLL